MLAVASTVGFLVAPVWTPHSPRPMSLMQLDSEGEAQGRLVAVDVSGGRTAPPLPGDWKYGTLPGPASGRGPARAFWWTPVKPSGEPGPEVSLESWAPQPDGRVRAVVRLNSTRGATFVQLRLDSQLEPRIFKVGDFALEKPADGGVVTDHSIGRSGVAIEFDFRPRSGATITIRDETSGLPVAARAVGDSRSAAMTPIHRGDRLVVSRTVRLTPALK